MTLEVINALVVSIGVPAIVLALIYIGRKLQVLDTLETTTEKLKTNVKIVCDFLTPDTNFDHTELQAYSPLQLTETGKKLISDLGFDKIFSENESDFFSFVDSENPRQKHDVETASIKSIYVLSDKEYMRFLKSFFYNNPTRTMSNTAPTLGIYIRDKYLEKHPEIEE